MTSQHDAAEAKRLEAVKRLNILDTKKEATFDYIVERAKEICGTSASFLSILDSRRQWLKSTSGISETIKETPIEFAFCAKMIPSRRPLIVPDALRDPRFYWNPLVLGTPNIRFYAGIPLIVANEVVGALCVIDSKPRTITVEQLHDLEMLGQEAIGLLEARSSTKAA